MSALHSRTGKTPSIRSTLSITALLLHFCAIAPTFISTTTALQKNYTHTQLLPVSENASTFYVLPNHRYWPDGRDHDDATYRAICRWPPRRDANEISCNVSLENDGLSTSSCDNVVIFPKDRSRRLMIDGSNVELVPLGDERIMLLWRETMVGVQLDNETSGTMFMGVNLLNMAKCKSSRLAFRINTSQDYFYDYPLALHRETIDFFIDYADFCADFSKQYDGKPPMCRVTYNLKGKRVGHSSFFWPTLYDLGFVHSVHSSPDQHRSTTTTTTDHNDDNDAKEEAATGFFSCAVDVNSSELIVSRLSLDGEARELLTARLAVEEEENEGMEEDETDVVQVMLGQSNGHGAYGICWVSQLGSRSVRCAQFDGATGETLVNVSIAVPSPAAREQQEEEGEGEKDNVVRWVDARNLPGGMLVIAGNCRRARVGSNSTDGVAAKPEELECPSFWAWAIFRDKDEGVRVCDPLRFHGLGLRTYSVEDGFSTSIVERSDAEGGKFCFLFAAARQSQFSAQRYWELQMASVCTAGADGSFANCTGTTN